MQRRSGMPRWTPVRACAAAIAVAILSTASGAPGADDTGRAPKLYEEGQRLLRQGQCKEAVVRLEEAYRLRPQPNALLQLGLCYRQLGQFQASADEYVKFLRLGPSAEDEKRVRDLLEQVEGLNRKQKRAERSSKPELERDWNAWPTPPRPGGAAGAPRRIEELVVVGDMPKRSALSLVLLGGGVAAAGAGLVFGLRNRSALSDYHAAQTAAARTNGRNQAQTAATVANVSWIASGVMLVAGFGILFFTDL